MTDTKIPFNNLLDAEEIASSTEDKIIEINDTKVVVKQYLPVNNKLELITNVLAESISNGYNFKNPLQIDVFFAIEVIKFYTNIEFDEEMTLDNVYDCLTTSGIYQAVFNAIPADEWNFLKHSVYAQMDEYYKYKNSAIGIMESIVNDYSKLDIDASKVQKELADPQNLSLLKDIVKKLG